MFRAQVLPLKGSKGDMTACPSLCRAPSLGSSYCRYSGGSRDIHEEAEKKVEFTAPVEDMGMRL